MAGTCSSTLSSIMAFHWVIDSGASAHICYCRDYFMNLHSVSDVSVTLPNNSQFVVAYAGIFN